jgi:hypothetical protein
MRARIAAAMVTGIVLIGILGWPLAAPADPLGPVRAGNLTVPGTMILALLAGLASVIAYFVCWPYGREMAVLATPSGLAIWAMRSGSIAELMQQNPAFSQCQALFATLRWEALFWVAIVAVGFAAAILGKRISAEAEPTELQKKAKSNSTKYLNPLIGLVGSGLIALFCLTILAHDIGVADVRLGTVWGQPPMGQIVFAVVVSFGLAAFVVKKFLNVSQVWPVAATALVTPFVISTYVKEALLEHIVQNWPPTFFSNVAVSILPLQMVAFGTLGSITGYWLAVRYNYRREHKAE